MEIVFVHKHIDKGYLIDIKIYSVPKDERHPEGFRYSLVLVRKGKRLLGYDNYEGKGHHIHRGNREITYHFTDEWKLVEDFMEDVRIITKGIIQ